MIVYRKNTRDSDGRAVWSLGVRALVCFVVLSTEWGVLHRPIEYDPLHTLYLIFAAMVFGAYWLNLRYGHTRVFYLTLSIQLVLELMIVAGIVAASGGLSSPFFALYLLTIVSAALSYGLIGTLLIATIAAITYVSVVQSPAAGPFNMLLQRSWDLWEQSDDRQFYAVFMRICILYILAFVGGYLAQKLKDQDDVLASTSRALQVARMETGDILKHLRSGLLTLNADGYVAYFNQAAEDILKIPARTVQGRSVAEAFGARHPELADRLSAALNSQQGKDRAEIKVVVEGGRSVPLGISTSIMGAEDDRRGVIAVFQDITDAKNLEERMRLKDRLAAIGELAAGIAHEIRNPLAAISGSVEVLINELSVQDENRNLLDLIVTESTRLNDIITEFLHYTRTRPTVLGRVRIGSVLEDVFEIVRHRPEFDGKIRLQNSLPKDGPLVKSDEDHLKQLLLNLVINAVEAIGDRQGMVTVNARNIEPAELPEPVEPGKNADGSFTGIEHWLRLTVLDDGPGIDAEILEKIWQPFYSTKTSGTGLGLSIVQRLVENIGGQIEIDSRIGEGTAIHIYMKKLESETKRINLRTEPSFQ